MRLDEARATIADQDKVIGHAIRNRTAYGRDVRRLIAERYRESHGTNGDRTVHDLGELAFPLTESRASSSSSASLGAFLPPQYLLGLWGLYDSASPSVINALGQKPLPATGMNWASPILTTGMTVSAQASDNVAPSVSAPVSTYANAPVYSAETSASISQQAIDRLGPDVTMDEVIMAQFARDAAAAIDAAVLPLLLANANVVTRSGTGSITTLWSDVAQAATSITTTAGQRLPVTDVALPSVNGRWFQSQVGSDGRPIWMPSGGSDVAPGAVGIRAEGQTGYQILGADVLYDDALAASGANARLVGDVAADHRHLARGPSREPDLHRHVPPILGIADPLPKGIRRDLGQCLPGQPLVRMRFNRRWRELSPAKHARLELLAELDRIAVTAHGPLAKQIDEHIRRQPRAVDR